MRNFLLLTSTQKTSFIKVIYLGECRVGSIKVIEGGDLFSHMVFLAYVSRRKLLLNIDPTPWLIQTRNKYTDLPSPSTWNEPCLDNKNAIKAINFNCQNEGWIFGQPFNHIIPFPPSSSQ